MSPQEQTDQSLAQAGLDVVSGFVFFDRISPSAAESLVLPPDVAACLMRTLQGDEVFGLYWRRAGGPCYPNSN